MAYLRLMLLAGASLLSLKVGKAAVEGATKNEYGIYTATRVDCRSDMNAARKEANLSDFQTAAQEGTKLKLADTTIVKVEKDARNQTLAATPIVTENGSSDEKNFLKSACKAMLKEEKNISSPLILQAKGTYMYAPQESAGQNCADTVQYWKEAGKKITTRPPAYLEGTAPYTDHRNISFMGLFNPSDKAAVDCAVITCQSGISTNTGGRTESETQHPQQVETGAKKTVNGLLCLSTPQALGGSQPPFTEKQWEKIIAAANSSISPTLCAPLAVAIAALVQSL